MYVTRLICGDIGSSLLESAPKERIARDLNAASPDSSDIDKIDTKSKSFTSHNIVPGSRRGANSLKEL